MPDAPQPDLQLLLPGLMRPWLSVHCRKQLTATLPSEVGLLTKLEYLILDDTGISGSLPTELGLSHSLREIHVGNSNMQGTLPEELYAGLTNLKTLSLTNSNG